MRVITVSKDVKVVSIARADAEKLFSGAGRRELFYGVVDAGRKTKTIVQKAVTKQMALKPGNYQGYVVAGTRGIPRRELLAFDIFGVKGGTDAEKYKGLRSVGAGTRTARKFNKGRIDTDKGTVQSGVWNRPRIFKRSFEANGDFYAFRPPSEGTSKHAPKIFWTFGRKPDQPRGADGKFASTGVKYGKLRRLYGPSLMKEIPEDESAEAFFLNGPVLLERAVLKRIDKLTRW